LFHTKALQRENNSLLGKIYHERGVETHKSKTMQIINLKVSLRED